MRLLLLLLALIPSLAAAQTPGEQARIAWVAARGALLFDIDRAAWVTTDDLRERVSSQDLGLVRGWTVERDGAGFVATYYVGAGDARAALYRGRVENRRVVSREVFGEAARPLLTPLQRRLADARGAVARFEERPCTAAPFNATVIPPETPDGPIEVYALTAQTAADNFPFGGHFRATLTASGDLSGKRGFMRACFNAPLRQPGGRPAALMLSHLLDPIPTEIHVFGSLSIGLPVYVMATDGERVWEVNGHRITLVQR